ncbi:hypothetical protein SRHO_G00006960 [Serrasalmus rhombeus]
MPTIAEARHLVDKLRSLLMSAGFELHQWASNKPGVISHLPEEVRSDSAELWLAHEKTDSEESTLGLSWHFQRDIIGYKYHLVDYGAPTMRNIYKVLATLYDPLGFILPYTTQAKMLVFVGTRVAEIQDLTDLHAWWYVDSARNPAVDITRGKTLQELMEPNMWSQGHPFLLQSLDLWPENPTSTLEDKFTELRKTTLCGITSTVPDPSITHLSECNIGKELLEITAQELHGVTNKGSSPTANYYCSA